MGTEGNTGNVASQIKTLEMVLGIDNGSTFPYTTSILNRMKTLEDKVKSIEAKLEKKTDEVDPCEEYPKDSYAFIALNRPESKEKIIFILFGLTVFLFQITFLVLLILSGTNMKIGTVEDSGNPDLGFLPSFIPPNASPIVRASQVLSLLAYVIFPQSTLQDVFNAIRFWSSSDSCDPVWCIRFSCALKGSQGISAIIAAWLLVMTSTTVVDIILNFTAITFISDLDELAFTLAASGMVGAALKEESERIANKTIPAYLDKRSKRVCYWFVMACTFVVLFVSMFYVVVMQNHGDRWVTDDLRVEFNDEEFKQYSGCFRLNKTLPKEYQRYTYNHIAQDKNISFRYCRDNRQWRMFNDINDVFDSCNATENGITNGVELARSSKTDSFDISTSFEESWVSSSGTPLDLYFFESGNLTCDISLGDGKCDVNFNVRGYQYDGGDCCAASCTEPNCGRESLEKVFNSPAFPEVAFPYCNDTKMVPITIRFNSFSSSRDPAFAVFDDCGYIDGGPWCNDDGISELEWRNQTPGSTYIALDCNQKNVLTVYADPTMVEGTETLMVQDGADCTLNVRNTTSTMNTFSDDPTWFINYTLYHDHGQKNDIQNGRFEILTQQSDEKGKEEFKRYPNCYFEKLKDHVDIASIYTGSQPTYEAIRWLVEHDPNGSECQEEFFIERFALSTIAYSMSGEDILESKENQCSWPTITCNNGEVKQISMQQKSLQGHIPTELRILTSLEKLDLDINEITSIPTEIGELTNLQGLYLDYNQITSIPTEIGELTNMQELRLYINKITSIPTEIGKLTNLQELYLGGNDITSIPTEIGKLTNLQELYLDINKITSIPTEIGKLTNLQELYLEDNQITLIPTEIGALTNLQYLHLDINKITSIPTEIRALTNLQYLHLDFNQIKSVPTEIGALTNLEELKLDYNQIKSIPTEIGELTKLQELRLDGNQITSIPTEIGQLTNLETVYLYENVITSIPTEIGELTNLQYLYWGLNQIKSISTEIGELTKLQELVFDFNQIKSIPTEIGELTNLQSLSLEDNDITSIPTEIGALTNLQRLYLTGNNFTLDDVPEEVKALCNSTFCDFFTWSPANTTYSNISHTDMMV